MAKTGNINPYHFSIRIGSFLILVMGLLLFNAPILAQDLPADSVSADTLKKHIKVEPFHSPKKASLLSAVLPGAGQIYNKQYWKAPIFWAGIGVSAWYLKFNIKNFKEFKGAIVLRQDTIVGNESADFANVSTQKLNEGIEYYRRYRDISYLSLGLFYLLNIVEASVGAHLFYFDVDEDISLNIQPYQYHSAQPAYGLRLTLNF